MYNKALLAIYFRQMIFVAQMSNMTNGRGGGGVMLRKLWNQQITRGRGHKLSYFPLRKSLCDSVQYVPFGWVTKIIHKSMSIIPKLGGKLILHLWISPFQVCTMVMLRKKSFFNCYMTYRMRTITVL